MYGAAYGVIADIATIDERGSFVGVLLLMLVFLSCLVLRSEADAWQDRLCDQFGTGHWRWSDPGFWLASHLLVPRHLHWRSLCGDAALLP